MSVPNNSTLSSISKIEQNFIICNFGPSLDQLIISDSLFKKSYSHELEIVHSVSNLDAKKTP